MITVVTPASRGVEDLDHLLRDFRNQTFKNFEHVIVWDGDIPDDVAAFMEEHSGDYNINFTNIHKDPGNMSIAPGTRPRNRGVELAKGSHVVFCDDDDRYRDTYLEMMTNNLGNSWVNVVQMSCQESRMFRDGDPTRIRLIPEVGMPYFPIICHVGTPCFIVPTEWARLEPWQEEPEHDFRFIKRICERFRPTVQIIPGMQVDVDGLVIQGMRDWVSIPPFFRE